MHVPSGPRIRLPHNQGQPTVSTAAFGGLPTPENKLDDRHAKEGQGVETFERRRSSGVGGEVFREPLDAVGELGNSMHHAGT